MTLEQGLDLEIDRWSYLCGTKDQKEGAAAFIENGDRRLREGNLRFQI